MKAGAEIMIVAVARSLVGKPHTVEELHDALFHLVYDIVTPWPSRPSSFKAPLRRTPLANEVLPRHQRATWARSKTAYDRADD